MNEEKAKTATLDELRDWLAVDDGWNRWQVATTVDGVTTLGRDTWHAPNQEGKTTINFGPHPHPHTLEGAAAALPDGWAWSVESPSRRAFKGDDGMPRSVRAFADNADELTVGCFAPDELTARYRLAVLCRLAEKAVEK